MLLEVTSPRIPCVTLATRMGDPQFVKSLRKAERFGLYCRVHRDWRGQVGDPVTVERYSRRHDFRAGDVSAVLHTGVR